MCPETTKDSRPYDSPRRREQAQETRARIAEAARRLFLERGWQGTRLRDVAAEAGVAEPTVYATYGSKAGLALALVDAVDLSADATQAMEELKGAGGDWSGELAALVAFERRLFERAGDVIALIADARRFEPALQEAYDEGRARGDRVRRRVLEGWPSDAFRDGVSAQVAADTFAALCNVDVYRLLRDERGWSADEIESWWHSSLVRLIVS